MVFMRRGLEICELRDSADVETIGSIQGLISDWLKS